MKTNHFFIAGILCLLLSSCATVTYFGDRVTPPTTSVDVYYSAHDVAKPYKVIGHLTCPNIGEEKVKEKFVAYGEKIGADAIVITGSTVNDGGKYTSDVVNADALKYK